MAFFFLFSQLNLRDELMRVWHFVFRVTALAASHLATCRLLIAAKRGPVTSRAVTEERDPSVCLSICLPYDPTVRAAMHVKSITPEREKDRRTDSLNE